MYVAKWHTSIQIHHVILWLLNVRYIGTNVLAKYCNILIYISCNWEYIGTKDLGKNKKKRSKNIGIIYKRYRLDNLQLSMFCLYYRLVWLERILQLRQQNEKIGIKSKLKTKMNKLERQNYISQIQCYN